MDGDTMQYTGKHRVPRDDRRQRAVDRERKQYLAFCRNRGVDPESSEAVALYTQYQKSS